MASKQKQRAIGKGLKNILKIKFNLILTEEVNCFSVYSDTWNFIKRKYSIVHQRSFLFGDDKDAAFERAKKYIE